MSSRSLAFLQDEVDSAWLYRALAELEPDSRLSDVYRRARGCRGGARPPVGGAPGSGRAPRSPASPQLAGAHPGRPGTPLRSPARVSHAGRSRAEWRARLCPKRIGSRRGAGGPGAVARPRAAGPLRHRRRAGGHDRAPGGSPPCRGRERVACGGPRGQRRAGLEPQPGHGRGRRRAPREHDPDHRARRAPRRRRLDSHGRVALGAELPGRSIAPKVPTTGRWFSNRCRCTGLIVASGGRGQGSCG